MKGVPASSSNYCGADSAGGGMSSRVKVIKIDPGNYVVTSSPNLILVTVLGSCIAACVRDPLAAIGGMNHFMLPYSECGEWGGISASLRYGNFAMERLINDILRGGGKRSRLEAKLFGGAEMIGGGVIGLRNAEFVQTYLRLEGIQTLAQHLCGKHARRVHYLAVSGQAFMRQLPLRDVSVASEETRHRAALADSDLSGTVELFD